MEIGVVAGGDQWRPEWLLVEIVGLFLMWNGFNRWICLVLEWVLWVVIVNGEFVLVLGSIWCSCWWVLMVVVVMMGCGFEPLRWWWVVRMVVDCFWCGDFCGDDGWLVYERDAIRWREPKNNCCRGWYSSFKLISGNWIYFREVWHCGQLLSFFLVPCKVGRKMQERRREQQRKKKRKRKGKWKSYQLSHDITWK